MKFSLQLTPLMTTVLLVPASFAQDTASDNADQQQTMVVSAAPQSAISPLDTPAAVSVNYGEDMRHAAARINLSEGLKDIPGLQVLNRQNFAQDLQMSIRGFGSRSTFGVRGIRLYVDGIPATMPDGQGQLSNIDIGSIARTEVLRGPFSALYGNASGGVVNIETETGSQPTTLESSSYYGSFGTWRTGLKASGAVGDGSQPGDVNYTVSSSRFSTHGYRDDSGAHKNLLNAKLGVRVDDASTLTLLLNSVDIKADDPGGLTAAEWHDNPRQAPRADEYHTRKTVKQTQAGLRYLRALSANDDLSVMTYAGIRETEQYQSIPAKVQQASQTHAGGVIDLTRHYQGIDTRWTHRQQDAWVPFTFTTGLDYETMTEQRKGYENFTYSDGSYHLGDKGALRRNERNLMWNIDPYLQTRWQLMSDLSLDAGVRYSSVWFDSNDHYITGANGDDSGDASYHKWLPAAALQYTMTRDWNLYLSAGRGFETPTINELSYRSDGKSGLNFGLQPSTNTTVELGSKWRTGTGLASIAVFQTRTKDEIVVDASSNGRTTYQNAGKTRRRGLELAWDQQFATAWRFKAAWTLLDATYREDVSSAIRKGNKIPGIARNTLFGSLGWVPEEGWYAGAEVQYMSKMQANDANTAQAPSYTVTALNTGYKFTHNDWVVDLFARVDNLFDKDYVGSVIVNESNGRYYEPAPGRNYGVGLSVSYAFNSL
ncbi:TonB-dependent receptor [Shimwellia pseudoproteus]|uniref:TonB-dependent receptor PqqU n=1 Tax=Shimwellia pseudoproteus TaxID=570012 RepID=UPI0018ECB803|nr:TonB-dependent receptor PqqU [Shimwellia pseudoproteus]MBJ3816132.1 TonB-dependent receptor [Shimwellia pseudoproteus]